MKAKGTGTKVAVATKKFRFGICDCTVDNDVGTCDFSLILRILHVFGHMHMRSHVSPGMTRITYLFFKEIQ